MAYNLQARPKLQSPLLVILTSLYASPTRQRRFRRTNCSLPSRPPSAPPFPPTTCPSLLPSAVASTTTARHPPALPLCARRDAHSCGSRLYVRRTTHTTSYCPSASGIRPFACDNRELHSSQYIWKKNSIAVTSAVKSLRVSKFALYKAVTSVSVLYRDQKPSRSLPPAHRSSVSCTSPWKHLRG